MKIAVATTTRADWGLLSPLAADLRDKGADISIMAGNMHLNPTYGMTVGEIRRDGFEPAYLIPAHGMPHEIAAQTLSGYAEGFAQIGPDAAVILGDRYEMLAVALAAQLSGVPIIHIAGGTISEGAIDDNIRHAITKLSMLHLVETQQCRRRVISMGESPERVVCTGAIGVHNIRSVVPMTRSELEDSIGYKFTRDTLLVTLHPATNDIAAPEERLKSLIAALDSRCDLGVIFTYPNNDTDPTRQIALIEDFCARNTERAVAVPSLGRRRYLSALRYVSAVAGNSSSGLVEVPSMGIPTLDIGIRQQGRERGPSVVHSEPDTKSILQGIDAVLSPKIKGIAARRESPYAKPHTLRLMSEAILSFPFTKSQAKKYYEPET